MLVVEELGIAYQPIYKSGSTFIIEIIRENIKLPYGKHKKNKKQIFQKFEIYNKILDDKLFVFSFIRDPWKRFVSSYLQYLKWTKDTTVLKHQLANWIKKEGLHKHLMKQISFNDFANFVFNESGHVNNHWKSQVKLLKFDLYNYDLIDDIEKCQKSFKIIEMNSNFKYKGLNYNKNNTKKKYNYKKYYKDFKFKDEFLEYYKEDIALFKRINE